MKVLEDVYDTAWPGTIDYESCRERWTKSIFDHNDDNYQQDHNYNLYLRDYIYVCLMKRWDESIQGEFANRLNLTISTSLIRCVNTIDGFGDYKTYKLRVCVIMIPEEYTLYKLLPNDLGFEYK